MCGGDGVEGGRRGAGSTRSLDVGSCLILGLLYGSRTNSSHVIDGGRV